MNIYKYRNSNNNYCSGDFFFFADNTEQADEFAEKFRDAHNEKMLHNEAYTIEWEGEIEIFPVAHGFMPLNRKE